MTWNDQSFMPSQSMTGGGRQEPIEVVGPHLRVEGAIDLGRFHRLSDLLDHTPGYLLLHGTRLLRRNGEPTRLTMPQLLLSQDQISFIAQRESVDQEPIEPTTSGYVERPQIEKDPRRVVIFTAGHTITGTIYLYHEQTMQGFMDASDRRFVPMTSVRARSLADRRVISNFALLLVNRTQIIAAAESTRLSRPTD